MKKSLKTVIFIIIVLLIGTVWFTFDLKSTNSKEVEVVLNRLETQQKIEEGFKTDGYTLEYPNVVVNPYGNSPLTALVMFETELEESPKVTIVGKDEYSTFEHTFDSTKKHYLPIYGLYVDSETEIIIECGDITKTLVIKTETPKERLIYPTSITANREHLDNSLYFFTPASVGYTVAYDVNGDIRWYLSDYALWDIERLDNGHLLLSTDRLINPPYYMTGLYEIDLLGKIYNEFSLPGGYHHDYFELKNGNFLIASDDFYSDYGTVEDVIVEIDRKTGDIIKTFDLKDVLKMDDGKSESWSDYDWFHNNSVWYDEETNSITLSGRHKDAVINIDYSTGKLNWIIGDPTNWNEEYQKYFFTPVSEEFEWQWSQHAAMITPEGYIFILDNGNNKSKIEEEYVAAIDSYTRGVMYKIDTDNMTIEQVWQYGKERGSEFYSPYISDVDYINEGHYIVHSGGIVYKDGEIQNQPAGLSGGVTELVSDTVEILNDEVIFEIKLPINNYRMEKMKIYTDKDNYSLGESKRLGTLGKTTVNKTKLGFMFETNEVDEEYEFHEIKLVKEVDRLVVSGRFKKDDVVNVILYKNSIKKVYNIRVSKKPYTALCIDIFSEDETENGIVVTKYINEKNLKGKYSIYLEINDTIYNTGEYVKY